MIQQYGNTLNHAIEREEEGTDYSYSSSDRLVLDEMFQEINLITHKAYRYLAEIDFLNMAGTGTTMAKFIHKFESESIRAFLIPQIVADQVKNCDSLILDLYLNYRSSDSYIIPPGSIQPAHIYVRYDNAFRILKPKRLHSELIKLAYYPRDVFYLPFTMKMLASWKSPEMEKLLLQYVQCTSLRDEDIGLESTSSEVYTKYLDYVLRQNKFTAIKGLKYFPSEGNRQVVQDLLKSDDTDIVLAAHKTLKAYQKLLY